MYYTLAAIWEHNHVKSSKDKIFGSKEELHSLVVTGHFAETDSIWLRRETSYSITRYLRSAKTHERPNPTHLLPLLRTVLQLRGTLAEPSLNHLILQTATAVNKHFQYFTIKTIYCWLEQKNAFNLYSQSNMKIKPYLLLNGGFQRSKVQ